MSSPPKKENRGGARPNSGPKPKQQTLTEQQIREMRIKADKYAKKFGKTIDEILLGFIYGKAEIFAEDEGEVDVKLKAVTTRDRIACIKLWKEYTSPKLAEGGPTDKALGPALYLPELAKAEVIPIKPE